MKIAEGEEIGGWKLLEDLSNGKGGNRVVWKAEREGTVGAIKLLQRRHVDDGARYARFKSEVQAMKRYASKMVTVI